MKYLILLQSYSLALSISCCYQNNYNIWQAFEGAKTTVMLQGGTKCRVGEENKFIIKRNHKPED